MLWEYIVELFKFVWERGKKRLVRRDFQRDFKSIDFSQLWLILENNKRQREGMWKVFWEKEQYI